MRISFARDVLPILSDSCFACHGPDAKVASESDLRLDLESDVRRDRGGYAVVTEGDLEHSELFQRIATRDQDLLMPPPEVGRPLSQKQIATLKRWIEEGGTWGRHWSFERIERPGVPNQAEHPVDYFINKNLEQHELAANPQASLETLIRRLKLDLTGLPPTPEQVKSFQIQKTATQDAWSNLVAETLASQVYGERMAWDWLEAARYADTNGYQGDRERTMWPWRDWVVQAFNQNMPFDQFTLWQIAGDQVYAPSHEQTLATGFFRNHMINGEGGRIAEENRVDYVMDMTETMGTVWLGLTLNCCRCHDHKFDPLRQKEYYQLSAFFNQTPVDGSGGNPQTPPILASPTAEQTKQRDEWQAAVQAIELGENQREQEIKSSLPTWEKRKLQQAESAAWQVLLPSTASAQHQQLDLLPDGLILASGPNPDRDEYRIEYTLPAGKITALRLDALRHPSMTKGGLARSNSGNFVLTEIEFRLVDKDADGQTLPVSSAEATFEQGGHDIYKAFDGDSQTGWAVWEGKPIEEDHAAIFRLEEPQSLPGERRLIATLKFGSRHSHHNLGHFRLSVSSSEAPRFGQESPELLAALRQPSNQRSDKQIELILSAYFAEDEQLQQLAKQREAQQARLKKLEGSIPQVMVLRDQEQLRKTFVLNRGLYNQPSDEVEADTPEFLHSFRADSESPKRIDLARWIISRENPLTARVTVNRLWQMLFGIGLVKTPEDFGVQGEYPVQRELLDWLAVELMESGWDIKHLLTIILTSETYRRSSKVSNPELLEVDPENRLYARGPRYRLPSWMLHDQALAISGLLDTTLGGPAVFPFQPEGIWKEATFGKKTYIAGSGSELYRRSLYTYWRRIVGPTMFFDAAKRQTCEVKPLRTNTPMHALITLNEFVYVEAAKALALLCLKEGRDDQEQLDTMARRVLCRKLTPKELTVWKASLARAQRYFEAHPEEAQEFLQGAGDSQAKQDAPELQPIKVAAFATICLNALNLDEVLCRE